MSNEPTILPLPTDLDEVLKIPKEGHPLSGYRFCFLYGARDPWTEQSLPEFDYAALEERMKNLPNPTGLAEKYLTPPNYEETT